MKSTPIPRPLLLIAAWLLMLIVALVFLYVIENAIVANLPWFGEGH